MGCAVGTGQLTRSEARRDLGLTASLDIPEHEPEPNTPTVSRSSRPETTKVSRLYEGWRLAQTRHSPWNSHGVSFAIFQGRADEARDLYCQARHLNLDAWDANS